MPKNKLASFRYRVINNCLRNTGRKWNLQNIIDEISEQLFQNFGIDKGISRRTVFYDIELMRSLPPRGFDAPIETKDGFYYYEDTTFSIDNIPLSEKDLGSINDAISLLEQFNQLPISTELSLIKEKLYSETFILNTTPKKVIEFENKDVKGSEFLIPLYKCIKDKNVLETLYHPFKHKSASQLIVHPYFLKQYNSRWYLIAYCKTFNKVGFYSLDRLVSFSVLVVNAYNENLKPEAETYFKDIIGISLPENGVIQKIVLYFFTEQAPYIKTKQLHISQQIITESEHGIEISLNLIPNYEFFSLILSFGSSVTIISPDDLRTSIITILENSIKNYTVQKDCTTVTDICSTKQTE
jgi:predicted DNA-binding transcriptional regulator YafY